MNPADHKNAGLDRAPLKPSRFIALLLALVTMLLYLPVCFHDFIYFDDPTYITDNNMVQNGLTWAGLKWAFTESHGSNWLPLTWLSHMLDCQLFGLNAGAHHCVNVIIHAINVALLFVLWFRLTGALWPSVLVAALFGWHPLHIESVAWISERKDVLSTFFGLLALIAYAAYARATKKPATGEAPRGLYYVGTLFFFALGLMAKPMLVTLPCVFLLLDYWPLRRIPCSRLKLHELWPLVKEKMPFFALTACSCAITFLAQREEAIVSLQTRSLGLRIENALLAYALYLLKIVWPAHLAVIYPLPQQYSAGAVVAAGALLAGITLFVWRRRKSGELFTGWFWFSGMLAPVIGLVQVGNQAMADRYTYLPAVGLFAGCAFGLAEWTSRHKAALVPARLLAGLVLIGCIAVTERQLAFWKNTRTLFSHALDVTDRNAPAHMMLGVAFERDGQLPEALHQYREALALDDSLLVQISGGTKRRLAIYVPLLMAQTAERQGDSTNAITHYREALAVDPALVEAHINLAILLDQTGAFSEALAHYQTAVRLSPRSPLVRENLGTLLLNHGSFEEAQEQYHEAARLEPNSPLPCYLMGKAWLRRGRSDAAAAQFQQALTLDTNDVQSLTYLARIRASDENETNRNGAEAIALAQQANALTGGTQPFILDTLAMAYAEHNQFDIARQVAEKAIEHTDGEKTPDLRNAIQQRQLLYQKNLPYRDAFTNTLPAQPKFF